MSLDVVRKSILRAAKFGYRADIDGIRAIAVLLVVDFHFHLVPGVNSGFMGVDMFFVISGFLITAIIQGQLDAGTFRLKTFWVHRIRRLAPALLATTVLTLAAGWLWLLPGDFAKLAQQTIAAQLYVANIFYWRNVNYFGLQAHDVYLLHTWSLAVEEQFYLFFPLVMLAIAWWARGCVAIVLIALTLISFALNLGFVATKPEATFYLMPTRAWELMAGALVALNVMRAPSRRPLTAGLCGFAGLTCLAIAIAGYRPEIRFPGLFAVLPCASAMLLIFSGSAGSNVTSRLLSLPPLVYIGKISYPLYLVHWPVNVFAVAALGSGYTWSWRLSMLLVSAVLAVAIYHCVERPSRGWLERSGSRAVLGWYTSALVAAVALSIYVLGTDGAASRYPDRVVKLDSYSRDMAPPLRECEYARKAEAQPQTLCRLGTSGVAPIWFVYGDSHAWATSGAIDLWLKKRGQSAFFMFLNACPPVVGVYLFPNDVYCFRFNGAVLGHLDEQPTVKRVLLVSTWLQASEGVLTPTLGLKLTPAQSIGLFDRQFAVTVQELGQRGKSVYIWEPLPGARESVPSAMARSELKSLPLAIDITHDEYLARYAFFFETLKRQQENIAGTFSPARELCLSGRCVTQIGGVPVYFDNGHLTYSLRDFWADALSRQMPN